MRGVERRTLAAQDVVLSVWRQAVADLRDGDEAAWRWLATPAFDRWALLYDPSLDPEVLRAVLRRAFGRGPAWSDTTISTPSPRRSALTANRRA